MKVGVVSDDFLDMGKSLNQGAVQVPFFLGWEAQAYALSGFFDNDKKLSKFTKDEMELLLHGKDRKFQAKVGGRTINLTYAGCTSARCARRRASRIDPVIALRQD